MNVKRYRPKMIGIPPQHLPGGTEEKYKKKTYFPTLVSGNK
jgi:hypothetical protein